VDIDQFTQWSDTAMGLQGVLLIGEV
jgi:hypothetical protein